jgi:phage terminase large subunit GpA-like protein
MLDAGAWADEIWRRGLAPDALLTIDEWAERFRVLPPSSAEPGPWRTDRLPFLREIMVEMTPTEPFERVCVMKAAQVGATEMLLNFIGYVIALAPANMLLVMPSLTMIRENTPRRIDPMIEHTPEVRRRVVRSEGKVGGNTRTEKRFAGGQLNMAGATSAAGLRSIPAPYVLLDEVDAYPPSAGEEGDPVALALRAQTTYIARRKSVMISTPLTKGFSRIEKAFIESDQRQWFCPCPHCHEHWCMRWENVHWPEGRRDLAHLVCPHCGGIVEERERHAMVAAGEWRATAPGDGRTAGFHIGGLLTPFRTLAQFAIEHGQVYRDPARYKVFKNTWLGELWDDEAGPAPDSFALMDRLEDWGKALPAGVVVLTAGVDVQDDRLELEIVGWGRDEESWSIDFKIIWGDPAGAEVWKILDQDLRQTFAHARAVPAMPILACAIDSGGHHTASVYGFTGERHQRHVWAIKGRGGAGVPIWPRRPARASRVREKSPVYLVGVDTVKETTYARLKLAEPGPGYCHLPAGRDREWFIQLTSERQATRYVKGRAVREWRLNGGARNEALDCRVYATAALHGLIALGLRLNRSAEELEAVPLAAEPATSAATAQQKSSVIKSRWLE